LKGETLIKSKLGISKNVQGKTYFVDMAVCKTILISSEAIKVITRPEAIISLSRRSEAHFQFVETQTIKRVAELKFSLTVSF